MTKSVRSSPGTRGEQTRERILRAAGKLIGSVGYRKTTITEIARLAGIGKATVYLYFEDKQDLFTFLVRRETRKILELIEAAVAAADTVQDQLLAFVVTRYRTIQTLLDMYQAGPQVLLEEQEAMQQAGAEYREKELALVTRILHEGMQRGVLDTRDPRMAALALTGTLVALDQGWIFGRAEIDLEQSAHDLVHLFLHGVIARKETP
jgi:AcrR family transcriptional regulator